MKTVLFSPEKMVAYIMKALAIIVSLAVIYVFYRIVIVAMDRALRDRLSENRLNIIASLVRSILRYGVFFVMFITTMQQLGVNITALIASAGILGLAVSFGSQNLVRDLISGFFIILEKQYSIGDTVQIMGIKGKVADMSLRLTILKADDGTKYSIPNGNITTVQNFGR
ncbi:MAG: mechanosensitive ion channel family protein [Candidatus Margulisbacteria bacterium]|nr:mechanosensitive ion channel family protein [Candidatus Margulisiibacteriota bacterium]MBU1021589.1 mechanosensitive ion channel family protein [Candidatus Margulisiibacteriota bacterium]MBU1955706.1 mechanosensitive ion channel family protein [Candidatus Margulisiibacteriota bacterium]